MPLHSFPDDLWLRWSRTRVHAITRGDLDDGFRHWIRALTMQAWILRACSANTMPRSCASFYNLPRSRCIQLHVGNRNASIFALGFRPSISSESTRPVPGACDMPHAPCPAAMKTPPSAPPLVFTCPSFSSGIRDTMGRPLDVTGRKHCSGGQQ